MTISLLNVRFPLGCIFRDQNYPTKRPNENASPPNPFIAAAVVVIALFSVFVKFSREIHAHPHRDRVRVHTTTTTTPHFVSC